MFSVQEKKPVFWGKFTRQTLVNLVLVMAGGAIFSLVLLELSRTHGGVTSAITWIGAVFLLLGATEGLLAFQLRYRLRLTFMPWTWMFFALLIPSALIGVESYHVQRYSTAVKLKFDSAVRQIQTASTIPEYQLSLEAYLELINHHVWSEAGCLACVDPEIVTLTQDALTEEINQINQYLDLAANNVTAAAFKQGFIAAVWLPAMTPVEVREQWLDELRQSTQPEFAVFVASLTVDDSDELGILNSIDMVTALDAQAQTAFMHGLYTSIERVVPRFSFTMPNSWQSQWHNPAIIGFAFAVMILIVRISQSIKAKNSGKPSSYSA